MYCPICREVQLVMTERSGIEIDYCPQCRGVWLDRGELDKIIERSSTLPNNPGIPSRPVAPVAPIQPPVLPPPGYPTGHQYQPSHHQQHHSGHDGQRRKKKHHSFLGDLFDFD